MPKKYDAFLSHSSSDEASVEELAHWLMEQGVRVWFDRWELIPGEPWQEALERGLRESECCVVFVGSDGMRGWHNEEMRAALTLRLSSHGLRVVPALLSGARRPASDEEVPEFLTRLQWADLGDEDGRNLLLAGIRCQAPGPTGRTRTTMRLESIVRRLDDAKLADEPTVELEQLVLGLKRELRQGQPPDEGDILGNRFRLGRMLGRGGFATVWKALDLRSRRVVAVKVLHGDLARFEERRERFFRGARQMAALDDHPGIVRVLHPMEEDPPFHYFVMEYVDGGDFRQAALSGMSPEAAIDVVLKVGVALQYAHERGVVHRDVKPANILLSKDGAAKLTDFDLVWARDTTGGTRTGALGSYLYSAPEVMDDAKAASPRADVYSLGMTLLYGLCRGALPSSVVRDLESSLGDASTTEQVRTVVRRALEWQPERRFVSAARFVESLQRASTAGLPAEGTTLPTGVDAVPESESGQGPREDSHKERGDEPGRLWLVRTLAVSAASFLLVGVANWFLATFPWVTPNLKMPTMLWIQPGTFRMGDPDSGSGPEGPQHQVKLSRGFYLSRTEVTQGQYEAVMGRNPSFFTGCGANCPVEDVNWYDALKFCNKLSELEGLSKCYEQSATGWEWKRGCTGYRLPTEAEWEYAARAGEAGATYDDQVPVGDLGWYVENSMGMSHPVGEKIENAWGLHDMLGNVWEWCWDEPRAYTHSEQLDPAGATRSDYRSLRGGSWDDAVGAISTSARLWIGSRSRAGVVGFRIARSPE